MKRILLMIAVGLLPFPGLMAQRVVWQDDFETSKGWSEYEYQDCFSIVKDGAMFVKNKGEGVFLTTCKTNYDGNKNFVLSVEAQPELGLKEGQLFGIAVDYRDAKNFVLFAVEMGFVRFLQYENGQVVREERDYIKSRKKTKNVVFTLELQKKGQNIMFVVNGEETLDMDDIIVHSNKIGLLVGGEQTVMFDNVKISQ